MRLSMKTIAHVLPLALALAALSTAGTLPPLPGLLPLCNTGVVDTGDFELCTTTLAAVGAADMNWNLSQIAPFSSGTALTVAQLECLQGMGAGCNTNTFGPVHDNVADSVWLPNGPNSEWLTPSSKPDHPQFVGQYVYETDFSAVTTAVIEGQYSSDNELLEVFLNDALVTAFPLDGPNGFDSWTQFTLTSGFVSGTNTLDFVVQDDGVGGIDLGPAVTGFRAELGFVPEPSTMVLGLLGLGSFMIFRRRRG